MIRSNKIKSIEFLINKFRESNGDFKELPKCSFLFGAGCSRSSNIPTGYGIIEHLKKLWYIKNYTDSSKYLDSEYEIDEQAFDDIQDDFETKCIEAETELKEKALYSFEKLRESPPKYLKTILEKTDKQEIVDYLLDDLQYGFWFEQYSENPRERQKFIEYHIDTKEPSAPYLLLAHLIANRKITNLFTTNFDDLIYDAVIRYTDIKPKTYSHNEVAQYINPLSVRPNIIKLHGDFLFENIKNTKPETELLWNNMQVKFEECLKSFDLVVVGYNGADESIMNVLSELKSTKYGLLWCGRNPEKLNWRVKELINHSENSFFVEIESFEHLVIKLYEVFKDEIDIPDFRKNAEQKEIELNEYISDLQTELSENPQYSETQKEEITKTLDVILDRNSFYRVAELPINEQLDFLRKLRIDGISRTIKNIHTNTKEGWENADYLFKELDIDNFFQDKLNEATIQHISNALSNLKKVNFDRTKSILDKMDNAVLISKIEVASPADLYSAINELRAISKEKIDHVVAKREVGEENLKVENLSLRQITYQIKTLSQKDGLDLLISKNDLIQEKIKAEDIKESTLFLDNISNVFFKECQNLFIQLDTSLLISKMNEQSISLLSSSLKIFNRLDKRKTKTLIENLDFGIIESKLNETNLHSFKSLLFTLKDVDFSLSKKLFAITDDTELNKKIEKADLLSIAEALEYLSKIDFDRMSNVANNLQEGFVTAKIDSNEFTYQQFGTAMAKLLVFNHDKFCREARSADSNRLTEMISESLNKTGEQVFLHFVPTYFKVDKFLFEKIISKASQGYIDAILKWPKIDLYTVNLPYLKRIFDQLKLDKESKYLEYIIGQNQNRFTKKKRKKRKNTRHNNG